MNIFHNNTTGIKTMQQDDGKVWFYYGNSRGSKRYDTMKEALHDNVSYLQDRIDENIRESFDLIKMRDKAERLTK